MDLSPILSPRTFLMALVCLCHLEPALQHAGALGQAFANKPREPVDYAFYPFTVNEIEGSRAMAAAVRP